MKVYLLIKCVEYKGYDVKKVYTSKEKAYAKAFNENSTEPLNSDVTWEVMEMEVET